MMWLWLCLLPAPEAPLRVIFDVQIFYEQRNIVASMALNHDGQSRFSISCRKSPSGTLFTYWGTDAENLLWFPKAGASFSGPKSDAFGLFPGGPEMTRDHWLTLLLEGPPGDLGSFRYQQDDEWHMLADHERQVIIRWRERKRKSLDSVPDRALQPRIDEDAERYGFFDFPAYWADHGFE